MTDDTPTRVYHAAYTAALDAYTAALAAARATYDATIAAAEEVEVEL